MQVTAPGLFAGPAGGDLTDPRVTPQVRRGRLGRAEDVDREILKNYQGNLEAMAQLLRDAGVPGVFCSVPVNLSAWAPFDAPGDISDPDSSRVWLAARDQAFDAMARHAYEPAIEALQALLGITPDYAYGHFLLGESLQRSGRYAEALQEFDLACDLDPRPVRAVKAFQSVVRTVGTGPGMTWVDLKQDFLDRDPEALSGLNLFLDYVHPTDDGHRLAAAKVLASVMPTLAPAISLSVLEAAIRSDDWILRHAFNQADVYYTLGMTLFNNGDLVGAERAYLQALKEDPAFADAAGNLGVLYDRIGNLAAAQEYYALALRVDPGTTHAANYAGLLYRMGDLDGAWALGNRLLQQGVVDAGLMEMLGHVAFEDQRYADALTMLRQAEGAGKESAELQMTIGDTLRQLGDDVGAQQAYKRAESLR